MAKKISDEIRKWCDLCGGIIDSHDKAELDALAGRIDAEMMELPRDRDGVPIHVGDTVWDVEDGMEFVVKSVTLYAGGVTKVDAVCTGCHAHVSPDSFSHTRPDSWERIADELEAWCDDSDVDGDACDVPRAIAGRIRRLAERED